jgi:transcriptional regulator with XRE-family HTH domain
MYLEGMSQEQIAIELDISEGTVSGYLQELRELDDTVALQHEIAVVCKKYSIPIQQLASELTFSNAIKKTAFDQNKIDLLLRVINNVFLEDGSFLPEKVAMFILQICNFMEVNNIGLDEAHNKVYEKSIELKEIKNKIAESKKIITEAKKCEKMALRRCRLTRAELRRFTVFRKASEFVGFDFKNFKKVSNVLSVIHQLDGNPDRIINEMKKTTDLELRKSNLGKDCDEVEKYLEIYREEKESRKLYKGAYSTAIELVTRVLVSVGTAEEIAELFDTIMKNKCNFPLAELTKDIDTYGCIKSAIFKIKREQEKIIAERENPIESTDSPYLI